MEVSIINGEARNFIQSLIDFDFETNSLYFPQYRPLVKLVKNLSTLMEELHKARIVFLDDIVAKLSNDTAEIPKNVKSRFVPSVEVYNILTQKELPIKYNTFLTYLLHYLIIKLDRSSSEDADYILKEFKEVEKCIFTFRKYSTWDYTQLDEIIEQFLRKLIQMMNKFSGDNSNEKFPLFAIMRIMITSFGKHPVYGTTLAKLLREELDRYWMQLNQLVPTDTIGEYVFEIYLTHLYILNDIIGHSFINKNKEGDQTILKDLQNVLNNIVAMNKMSPPESHLIESILGMMKFFLSV